MSNASVLQDADVSLYLHAELLPNIRQITLYVSLPQTPALDGIRPQIELSESRKAVTVSLPEPLDHVSETIKLPARVSDANRRTLNINTASATALGTGQPDSSSHDYSFRMQVDPSDQALLPRDEVMDDYVPWTAADMSPSTRVRCRECGNIFMKDPNRRIEDEQGFQEPTQGWAWKDLPSGNWAEMMDFWHCHKPDPHEGDLKAEATAALKIEEQNAQIKGYGAWSRVEAIPGTVLIDVATFLLAVPDCVGLTKVSTFLALFLIYHHLFQGNCVSSLDLGNQKEAISFPCCGLRYYCPRSKFVHRFSRLGLVVSGSVHVNRLQGQLSSLDRWISSFVAGWVGSLLLPPCLSCFSSTLFDFNGSLGLALQRIGTAVNRRGTSTLCL